MDMAYRQLLERSGRSIICNGNGGLLSYTRNGGNLLRQVSHRNITKDLGCDQGTLGHKRPCAKVGFGHVKLIHIIIM